MESGNALQKEEVWIKMACCLFVNPIMSETSGEDGDHGLHGFGLMLLGTWWRGEHGGNHSVRCILKEAWVGCWNDGACFLLHHHRDHVLVWPLDSYQILHQFFIDRVDPVGHFLLNPECFLKHFVCDFLDLGIDVLRWERGIIINSFDFHFCFYTRINIQIDLISTLAF